MILQYQRSEDGGKEWSEPELPFHYEDYADNTLEIPGGSTDRRVNQSASFIDPVLLQDEETEQSILDIRCNGGWPDMVLLRQLQEIGYKKEIQGKNI
ncbi:MAG: hypothetical protein ACLTKE_12245 [Coprococcus sp.]